MAVKRLFLLALLACCALALGACGPSNSIRLHPLIVNTNSTIPTPSAKKICVVKFVDDRGPTEAGSLGLRRDGSNFLTPDDPGDWVARSFADAMSAKGYQVIYAHSASESRGNYILSGQIETLKLTEQSPFSYDIQIRIHLRCSNKQKGVLKETFSASQTVSSPNINEDKLATYLEQSLKEIVVPASQKISDMIGGSM